jgi:hypothetical protein
MSINYDFAAFWGLRRLFQATLSSLPALDVPNTSLFKNFHKQQATLATNLKLQLQKTSIT